MEGILKKNILLEKIKSNKQGKEKSQKDKELIENIKSVKLQLASVESRYNLLSDNNLIEALIFEENALKARYAYLLSLAKDRNTQSELIF